MIARIKQVLAAPVFEGDIHKTRIASLTNLMLVATLAATVLGTIALIPIEPTETVFNLALGAALVAMVMGLRFLLMRGHVRATGILLSSTMWAGITVLICASGSVRDPSVTGYFLVIGIAAMLLGKQASVVFGLLSILATLAIFHAETSGILTASPMVTTINLAYPITFSVTLGLTTMLARFAVRSIGEGFQRAHRYAAELEKHKQQLEKRVAERTHELARRACHLEATATIAREATSVLDIQELLPRAAALINTQLGFQHTEIFLLDSSGEWAVLRAAADESGERGQRMLARGHKVKAGDAEIVGQVAASGEPRIAVNVESEAEKESTSPDTIAPLHTRSELSVPIEIGPKRVGVLDVQSPQRDAFDEEDVRVMETLADQIAVAIENARLYEAIHQELAERKQAEEALAESVSLLEATLESTTDGILVVDTAGKIAHFNRRFAAMWRIPEDVLASREDERALAFVLDQLSDPDAFIAEVQGLYNRPEAESFDVLHFKDGRTFERYARPQWMGGEVAGRVWSFRDVTERKRAEEQLQRYAADLEQRHEEVEQFTYTFTHHLRTPLVNLKGFSAELRAALAMLGSTAIAALPCLDEKQRQTVTVLLEEDVPEALDFIDASTTRMDHLITAVLKLSRLGRREIHPEPVDMDAVVQAVLRSLAPQIEERDIRISVGPLPDVVADRRFMKQIMSSLLKNAILYLDGKRPGEIEVAAESGPDGMTFYVRDNGRGIAEDDMHKVFAPFRRAGRQDVPGEGMGLPYAQTLVRRHGGRMWCESELGVGTTFAFTIPHHLVEGGSDV